MIIRARGFLPAKGSVRFALLSAILLLIAGVVVTVYEDELYRAQRIQDLSVQADILAASVTAALSFNDRAAAQEYANALQANPDLEAAGVYNPAGMRIAGFVRRGTDPLPVHPQPGAYLSGDHIYVTEPVLQGSNILGLVFLRGSIESLGRRLARYTAILLLVIMAVLVLAVSALAQRALARANGELEAKARELTNSNARLQEEMQERARAEEALRQSQKMEALGQLSGGIAHDLNNLLAIIQGNLQMLQRRTEQGRTDVQKYIESAMQGISRGATLTRRILAFSRQQPLTTSPTNVSTLSESMRDLVRQSVGPEVELNLDLCADWLTLCDANQMESVILNLAINARDAMPRGGKLQIRTTNVTNRGTQEIAAGDYVQLEIIDTGMGMSEEVRRRALDPFFTTKPQGKGTGLGLSTTFGYVRQLNGYLQIDSKLGKGTVIRILMPRYNPQAAPVAV
jgi:signal transduction histidine kinase